MRSGAGSANDVIIRMRTSIDRGRRRRTPQLQQQHSIEEARQGRTPPAAAAAGYRARIVHVGCWFPLQDSEQHPLEHSGVGAAPAAILMLLGPPQLQRLAMLPAWHHASIPARQHASTMQGHLGRLCNPSPAKQLNRSTPNPTPQATTRPRLRDRRGGIQSIGPAAALHPRILLELG